MPSMKASARTGMMMMGMRSALVPDMSALPSRRRFQSRLAPGRPRQCRPWSYTRGNTTERPPSHPGTAPGARAPGPWRCRRPHGGVMNLGRDPLLSRSVCAAGQPALRLLTGRGRVEAGCLCLPPTRRLAPIAWQLPYEVDGAADHDRHGPQPEREAEAGLRGCHARVDGPAQEDRLDGQEDPQEDLVPLAQRRPVSPASHDVHVRARPVRFRLRLRW